MNPLASRVSRTTVCCVTIVIVLIAAGSIAAESACGVFEADEGNNIIVWGIAATEVSPSPTCVFPFPYGDRRIGVCWRDKHGEWRSELFPRCDTYATDRLQIHAGEGDDVVMPVTFEFLNTEFRCPAGDGGLILLPYHEKPGVSDREACDDAYGCVPRSFEMGVTVFGGDGADEIYGSPESDHLRSGREADASCYENRREPGCGDPLVEACVCAQDSYCCKYQWDFLCLMEVDSLGCTDDDDNDLVCGLNGDDLLRGDGSTPAGKSCLNGGRGEADYNLDACLSAGADESPAGTCEWTDTTEVPAYDISYCCNAWGCGFWCFELTPCTNACGDPHHPPFQTKVASVALSDGFDPWFAWDNGGCSGGVK